MEAGLACWLSVDLLPGLPDIARQCFQSRVHRWIGRRSHREPRELSTLRSHRYVIPCVVRVLAVHSPEAACRGDHPRRARETGCTGRRGGGEGRVQ